MYSLDLINNPTVFRRLVNLWPPLWAAGISVREVSADWMYARIRLSLRFYNRNFIGTQYGGSLFSMTDMMYMLMLLHHIGRDHWVWDKSADINFIKPGRGPVYAEFMLDQTRIDNIVAAAATKEKHFEAFEIEVKNNSGELIAKVGRLIYVRQKPAKENPIKNER